MDNNLHDRLVKSKKLYDIIKKLGEQLPSITDIRQISNTLHICEGNTAIPFYLIGDGIQSSLTIMAMTLMLERGILVLEEPENSMHPGLIFRVVDELLSACKNNKMQIFLSSHSDEFVKSALEMQADTSVSVHNMNMIDGESVVRSFDQCEAKEHRLDLQLDLRGLW